MRSNNEPDTGARGLARETTETGMVWLTQTLTEARLGMRGSVTSGAPAMSATLSVKDQKD